VDENVASADTVSLTAAKYDNAGIATEPARMESLAEEIGVVGRIEINADHRVEIRPRAAGIIREVHVSLGQLVKRGDPLVTLDSPDVGTARLNLRDKQRLLATARFEQDWRSQIAASVAKLIPELRKGTDPGVIEKQFADQPLGTYRGTLLGVYSEYDIAAHEETKTKTLSDEKIYGEHPTLLARHRREGVQARLEATIEQVRFDAAQADRIADQNVKRAEADVIDAAQRLRILGVPEDIRALLTGSGPANRELIDADVTCYRIDAPFDGTITTKAAVLSQKADPVDILFTLADLRTVWITANIPESDVAGLAQLQGGPIRLTATSYPRRVFEARLLSTGATVDSLTRTLPLIAQADNSESLLKPGMFVRVILDGPTVTPALTVPSAAISEIEGKRCVFLPVASKNEAKRFVMRSIKTGKESNDRVVVLAGLHAGEPVVSQGAFILKSELILQNQADEE
jgi:RND family efflux transporter MFP subunit